jgi:hypothetical protein
MSSEPAAVSVSPIPALLRAARGAYGNAIRARLAAADCDDMPRNGPYVLGGMANHGGSAGDLIRQLGVTKQAASQLIDTLVVRGYLERQVDPEDRRRMLIALTERGRAAAVVAGLVALTEIRERMEEEA